MKYEKLIKLVSMKHTMDIACHYYKMKKIKVADNKNTLLKEHIVISRIS